MRHETVQQELFIKAATACIAQQSSISHIINGFLAAVFSVNDHFKSCLFAFKQAAALFLPLLYSDNFCCYFIAARSSFANVVKKGREAKAERPNCRNVSKRNEAREFNKNLLFLKSKLLGVAAMTGKSIDVTCKSHVDVSELYKMIQAVSDIMKAKII